MYTIFFTNHGYRSPQVFDHLEDAKSHVQRIGFEASIDETTKGVYPKLWEYNTVLSWSPLYGWRRHSVSMKVIQILEEAK